MAYTEHLPIYKSAYDLCLWLEQVVWGFSRYHKYSLKSDLRDGARRALKLVVRANARRDKLVVVHCVGFGLGTPESMPKGIGAEFFNSG